MAYGLKLVTAATTDPVSLTEARRQLGLGEDDGGHDARLSSLITGATEYVQVATGRQFINATFDAYYDSFPGGNDPILLPRSPLVSITSVKYAQTSDGVMTTWTSTNYAAVTSREPAECALAYSTNWTTDVRCIPEAVVVRFVAGYGSSATSVPVRAKQAILLLVNHWFDNGEAKELPKALQMLIQQLQVGEEFTAYA